MDAGNLACDWENIGRDHGLWYHRCRRCLQVLPSFDRAERTYFSPCPALQEPAATGGGKRRGAWRPRVPEIVRTFLRACRQWARAGFPVATWEARQARRTACRLCPLAQHVGPWQSIERCGSCRCWLPAKRLFATERCPAERWPGQRHADGRGLVLVGGKLEARSDCGCAGAATAHQPPEATIPTGMFLRTNRLAGACLAILSKTRVWHGSNSSMPSNRPFRS